MKGDYPNNIVYEYLIGKFSNLVFKRTPNIVQTCNLYSYISNEAYDITSNEKYKHQ